MPRANRGPRLDTIKGRPGFYIIWYDQGAKRVQSTRTDDRREAEEALANFIGRSHRNGGPREPNEVEVADALDIYAEKRGTKAQDPQRIGYAVDALLSFWDGKRLSDVTEDSCAAYVKARGVAAGTARRELGTLAAAINFMAAKRLLTHPVPVTLPPKPDPNDRWLTVTEAARLLNAARTATGRSHPYLPLFILIALYTGARKEAILSLRWPQVDMKAGRINFAIQGRAETKKRRAHLPIPDRLLSFLRYAWTRRSSDVGPVLHIDGQPIKRIDKGFREAAKRADLVGVTPHTLRHTRGTWLAQAGVDLWKIAGWLKQSPDTTARIYAHHHPAYMEDAKRATDRRK